MLRVVILPLTFGTLCCFRMTSLAISIPLCTAPSIQPHQPSDQSALAKKMFPCRRWRVVRYLVVAFGDGKDHVPFENSSLFQS